MVIPFFGDVPRERLMDFALFDPATIRAIVVVDPAQGSGHR
jgi:hypothetical protein